MAILRGYPSSSNFSGTYNFLPKNTVDDGIKFYGESVAKHLTEEELIRIPNMDLQIKTKIVKQNYWL